MSSTKAGVLHPLNINGHIRPGPQYTPHVDIGWIRMPYHILERQWGQIYQMYYSMLDKMR